MPIEESDLPLEKAFSLSTFKILEPGPSIVLFSIISLIEDTLTLL